MKITTSILSNFFKTSSVICRIERDNISYRELIEFLYQETPPENHNFLNYDYAPHINNIVRFGSGKNNPLLFSIIIPTYNRHELLLKTLNSVISQNNISPAEFEVIIVDNNSKDQTEKEVTNFNNLRDGPDIIYIRLKDNYEGDFARNIGVLYSRGPLIVFTDDDCIVPADWLIEFKRELDADPAIAGVGGFKVPRSTREHLDIYHRFVMWGHFIKPHVRTKNVSLLNRCGSLNANVCYRKDIFKRSGGFNVYFQHIGAREFRIRLHKSKSLLLYEPRMVEHLADFSLITHIKKLLPQSLDRYLLYKLHPDIGLNPSFFYFLKRTIGDIKLIFTNKNRSLLFPKSALDKIQFSFVSIITNFFLWFGKYWMVAFR